MCVHYCSISHVCQSGQCLVAARKPTHVVVHLSEIEERSEVCVEGMEGGWGAAPIDVLSLYMMHMCCQGLGLEMIE